MIGKKEQADATRALRSWFESQQIDPGDACVIMVGLIADLFLERSQDARLLQTRIGLHKAILALEIATQLKKVTR